MRSLSQIIKELYHRFTWVDKIADSSGKYLAIGENNSLKAKDIFYLNNVYDTDADASSGGIDLRKSSFFEDNVFIMNRKTNHLFFYETTGSYTKIF